MNLEVMSQDANPFCQKNGGVKSSSNLKSIRNPVIYIMHVLCFQILYIKSIINISI